MKVIHCKTIHPILLYLERILMIKMLLGHNTIKYNPININNNLYSSKELTSVALDKVPISKTPTINSRIPAQRLVLQLDICLPLAITILQHRRIQRRPMLVILIKQLLLLISSKIGYKKDLKEAYLLLLYQIELEARMH
uniref:Uncharacterized protein n=1 Tax=Panstrongylus lignarius TaxID=156445 RepID=A0A224XSI3_9HEMI